MSLAALPPLPARDGTGSQFRHGPMPAWVRCTTTWDRVSWRKPIGKKAFRACATGPASTRSCTFMSHYYVDSGQLGQRASPPLELYKQTYPRDSTPYNNLAVVYIQMGQFENALENARKAVQIDPDSASDIRTWGFAYAGLNRLDEAKATYNESAAAQGRRCGNSFCIGHYRLAAGRQRGHRARISPRSRTIPRATSR